MSAFDLLIVAEALAEAVAWSAAALAVGAFVLAFVCGVWRADRVL